MQYEEIHSYDIHNNPKKVSIIVSDNARHFTNDLYILTTGTNFSLDYIAKEDLRNLAKQILDTVI